MIDVDPHGFILAVLLVLLVWGIGIVWEVRGRRAKERDLATARRALLNRLARRLRDHLRADADTGGVRAAVAAELGTPDASGWEELPEGVRQYYRRVADAVLTDLGDLGYLVIDARDWTMIG